MNRPYYFRAPTTILSGPGVAGQVGEQAKALKAGRALVVTDPGLTRTPHPKTVTDSLASAGIAYEVFDRVQPDPPMQVVEDNVAMVKKGGFDVFVALGGGSSIDVAKGLRLLSQYGGKLRDYSPGDKVPGPLTLPLIAISTTAGTGSQVSAGGVYTDTVRGTKFAVGSPKMFPTLALNDPLVTMGAPASVTANAGMDALAHAVESYMSLKANPISDILGLEAIRLAAENLPKVMADGDNLEGRDAMLRSATLAIMAGANTQLGADHAVAMPICAMFELPHGLVVGMLLASVMEYNLEAGADRLAAIAAAMGIDTRGMSAKEAAAQAAAAVRALSKQVGQPQRLREVGVSEDKLDQIANLTMESHQVHNNRRQMSPETVAAMLRQVY
ncbi:MAG: iron-containing alcohol dehydrogenase family protein [Chloroflexota bacterium]